MYDKDFWIPNSWPHWSIISPPAPFLHYSHTSHDLRNTWFQVRWIHDILTKQISLWFHISDSVAEWSEAQLLKRAKILGMVHASNPSPHRGKYFYDDHVCRTHPFPNFWTWKLWFARCLVWRKKLQGLKKNVFSRPPICENAILRCGNAIFR